MSFIGIDWGTSSFRAWRMGWDGQVLGERTGPFGMSKINREDYAPLVEKTCIELGAGANEPVLICGMAGAKGGWVEAGYLDCPTNLNALAHKALAAEQSRRDVRILPGIAQHGSRPDVMRGEETILAGANRDGLFKLPGTHSKTVCVSGGELTHFKTHLTGELFDLLANQSTIGSVLNNDEPFDADSFCIGVSLGAKQADCLTEFLFQIRSGAVLQNQPNLRNRLSGLLIGAELAGPAMFLTSNAGTILADGEQSERYRLAIEALGGVVEDTLSARDCTQRGLTRFANQIWSIR